MALILSIETSENTCSVALGNEYELLGTLEITDGKSHASMLTVLIEKLLIKKEINFSELKAVAVSKGPGSYTGLRIGVSVAKGICYALNIPLISINTLQIMSEGFIQSGYLRKHNILEENILLCPLMDARRMEVYTAFFNNQSEPVNEIQALVLDSTSFNNELEKAQVAFFGSGSAKCIGLIQHSNALFVENVNPHASNMVSAAYDSFLHNKFEDIAYFEPFYLKDFVATLPKRKTFSF
jgi:tRNA threonylcarbamoyladenosine biosynthesis protein TsaB